MSYVREIPRDLFNEANLLKCYGQIYLNLERIFGVRASLVYKGKAEPFGIRQSLADGSLTIDNVVLMVRGEACYLYRPLNSREPWPLYLYRDDDDIEVFADDGRFTGQMLAFLKGEPPHGLE